MFFSATPFVCASATQLDVVPFDTVPPCDDCMARARVEGAYAGKDG